MPKLPVVSGRETIRVLEKLGYTTIRQRGSHVVLRKETDDDTLGTVVPLHDELAPGTLSGILRQAKVSRDEFLAAFNE